MNTELLECECKSTKRAQTMGGKVKMLIEGMLDYMKSEGSIVVGFVLQRKAFSTAS
jgi:hypothetical protein